MFYFDERYRGKGHGSIVLYYWEKAMKEKGYKRVLTSTLSNEKAQFFFRKHGYKDSGCLILANEALEIILAKSL